MENREIKFRAWLINNKMMLNVDSVYMYPDGTFEIDATQSEHSFEDLDHSEVILMQYTGLKDKEGKEIYEGDIVESIDEDGYGGTTEYQETVEFHAGAFYPVCTMPSDQFKIIGNIYENPELIKEANGA